MASNPTLKTLLKNAHPMVRAYVRELERRNAKLEAQIVKLETEKLSLNNRIKALKKSNGQLDLAERLRRARQRTSDSSS